MASSSSSSSAAAANRAPATAASAARQPAHDGTTSWLDMIPFLAQSPTNRRNQALWDSDVKRITRSVQQLKLKASQIGANNTQYRELRIILKELALLEKNLQEAIVQSQGTSTPGAQSSTGAGGEGSSGTAGGGSMSSGSNAALINTNPAAAFSNNGVTLAKRQLLKRTDELAVLSAEVRKLESMIVGDGNRLLPTAGTSGPEHQSYDGSVFQPEQNSSGYSTYDRGSIEDYTYAGEVRRQKLLIEEQEQVLTDMSSSLSNLKQIGQDIEIEINYHNDLLEELNENIGNTSSRLSSVGKRLQEVTKSQSSRCLLCYIGFLCVMLVILLLTM
ncbi:unnamed protein product [Amoebophrya sp. A120]|nr:unnamed protein product [Amoebophrya sp. A120]|eukprot:GSA120T00007370001.1